MIGGRLVAMPVRNGPLAACPADHDQAADTWT
jgi:hypothetical protein